MQIETQEVAAETVALKHCHNCETQLHGHYCAHCGQADHPLDPGFRDLLHEATHEFLHLDGKILATLKLLLFFPGRLTVEFLAGKRARFIGPIRLYLTMSVLAFLVMGYSTEKSIKVDRGEKAETKITINDHDPKFAQWLNRSLAHALEDPKEFLHETMTNVSHLMFVLVPLFALILRMIYVRRSLHYPAHVYFALHVHAFFFCIVTLKVLVGMLQNDLADRLMDALFFLGSPVYLFMAMRRVFGGSRGRTFLRFCVLNALYFPCFFVCLFAALCLTIARQ